MIVPDAGVAHPLGPSIVRLTSSHMSVNLAVFSRVPVTVFIFPPRTTNVSTEGDPILRDPVGYFPLTERTGDVQHIALEGVPLHASYAFQASSSGRLLHDLYAKFLETRTATQWMRFPSGPHACERDGRLRSLLASASPTLSRLKTGLPFALSLFMPPDGTLSFDWRNAKHPCVSWERMVIYEAHVRALTPQGTFESAVDMIPYLKWLGITTVQLMPVFEYDEAETTAYQNDTKHPNMWGYSPASWFMPMGRYSTGCAVLGLKTFVRALHLAGIECVLDVVYNHSGHGSCPLHFLNVQDAYYIGKKKGQDLRHSNISGCGNTLSPNSPAMADIIIESMRWFVAEYHVDGFRIDAAGVLCRDRTGNAIAHSPIMDRIAADPLLRSTKFIVEGWDAGDQIGSPNMLLGRFPNGDIISEWNPSWRDSVRKFWRGDGEDGALRESLRGCPRLYKGERPRGPGHGVNFIACHDGFCLADVVSYARRVNKDGYSEISFNCGEEGETTSDDVLARRARQVRNMILTLAVSRGIPMILQGDELSFSKNGHSNTWNDPERYACPLPGDPRTVTGNDALVQFVRQAFLLREHFGQLTGTDFYDDVIWLGPSGKRVHRDKPKSRHRGFLAFLTSENDRGERIIVAMNKTDNDIKFTLPEAEGAMKTTWRLLMETAQFTRNGDDVLRGMEVVGKTSSILHQSSSIYVGRRPDG